jgi:hypothetical protein
MMQVCKLAATDEWMCPESLDYIAECLEACEDPAMVQDLRRISPREALLAATKRVTLVQRERLRQWVIELNQQSELAKPCKSHLLKV